MQDIEKIYEEYFETVYKYLFCLTRNTDISEELTQETFYKAVKSINSFKGDCKISVWLCQIAKNLWYNEYKKNKKIKNINQNELEKIYSNENIENDIILNEEKIILYKKMQKLDEVTRNVILLRLTGDLSFKEIGIILNKTENWARLTFYRGKKKLKEVDENE